MSSVQGIWQRFLAFHPAWQLACAFLFVFAFRLAVVGLMQPNPMNPDYAEYERLASSMVQHGEFGFGADWRSDTRLAQDERRFLYADQLATSRPPGFPLVLAASMALGFDGLRAFQIIAVAVESINLLIIATLAAALFGRNAGVIAGLIWLLMPRSYAYIVYVLREPYITLFFLLGMALLVRVPAAVSPRMAAASGLCFGLGTYFKETIILTIVPAAAWLVVLAWRQSNRSLVVCACVLAFTAVATIAPWMVRNSLAIGEPSSFSNFGWFNVKRALVDPSWIATQPAEVRQAWMPNESMPAAEVDNLLKSQVMAYLQAQPYRTVLQTFANMAGFWSPVSRDPVEGSSRSAKDVISGIYSVSYFLLAFFAFWRWRHRPETQLVVITLGMLTLAHGMFPGYPRFRYPYDALLVVFSAGDLHYRWLKFRLRQQGLESLHRG